MFPKDALTKQISLLILGIFATAGLWLLIRNPDHILLFYPVVYLIVFLSFVFGGVFSSFVFVSLFTLISLVGILISSSLLNRMTFFIVPMLSWGIFLLMNRYSLIFETTGSRYVEEIEDGDIKLNDIKNKISKTRALCESHKTRIENYSQLNKFLDSVCGILDAKEFLLLLKKIIEGFWGGKAELEFAVPRNGVVRGVGNDQLCETSTAVIADNQSRIIYKVGFENANYSVLKSLGPRFSDDDLRFFSLIMEFSRIAIANMELYARTKELSIIDGLTGLFLRGYFMERLSEEFELAKGHNIPLSFAMIDIDFFKKVNDTYGHPAGDEVLRSLSYILKHRLRETDIIGRYGGEEFAVLMPHTKIEDAFCVMENIREIISKERFFIKLHGGHITQSIHFTVSIGLIETKGKNISSIDDLISAADKNLYIAKNSGRNRVVG